MSNKEYINLTSYIKKNISLNSNSRGVITVSSLTTKSINKVSFILVVMDITSTIELKED